MKMIQRGLFRVCFQPITMLNCCTTRISWERGSIHNSPAIMNKRTFVTIFSRNPQYNFSIDVFPDMLQATVHFCKWALLTCQRTWKAIMNSKQLRGNIDQYFPHTRRTIPSQNNTTEQCRACQNLPTLYWDPFCIFCNKCIGISNIWIRSQRCKDKVQEGLYKSQSVAVCGNL